MCVKPFPGVGKRFCYIVFGSVRWVLDVARVGQFSKSSLCPLQTLRTRQGWGKPGACPQKGPGRWLHSGARVGNVGRSSLGRCGDPEKCVWPEGGSATDKEGRAPTQPIPTPVACVPGVGVFCTFEQESARPSKCECRRLQTASYFARSRNSPEDVFFKAALETWSFHCE